MDINRRNFLKGALVTGAAAAAAVALPACSPAASSDASDAKSSSKGGETTGAKHTWEVAPEPIADIAETQDPSLFRLLLDAAVLRGGRGRFAAHRVPADTGGPCQPIAASSSRKHSQRSPSRCSRHASSVPPICPTSERAMASPRPDRSPERAASAV